MDLFKKSWFEYLNIYLQYLHRHVEMCQKSPCPSTAGCIQGWHHWRSNLEFLGCFLEASLNKYRFDGSVIWRTSYIGLVVYPTIYHAFGDYLFFVAGCLFPSTNSTIDRPLPIFSGCSPTSYRCTGLASDQVGHADKLWTCDEKLQTWIFWVGKSWRIGNPVSYSGKKTA